MSNVIAFPKNANAPKPQIIVSDFDGDSAEVKIQYEHIVNALSIYLQTMPFALPEGVDVMDVDMGVDVDAEGYVTLDLYFGRDKDDGKED